MAWWNPASWGKSGGGDELEPIPDTEQGRLLRQQMSQADEAYDQMYESKSSGAYSEMKESSYEAIRLARELGLPKRAAALEKTLEHRKTVFRDQLS